MAYFFIDESPRYLLLNKQYNLAVKNINKIINFNKGTNTNHISEEELNSLITWSENERLKNLNEGNFSDLISSSFKRMSILLWINIFLTSIIYYGIIFIFPLVFEKSFPKRYSHKNKLKILMYGSFLSIGVEMIGAIICSHLIELKSLGRRGTILIATISSSILFLISIFTTNITFLVFISLARSISCLTIIVLFVFSMELYPTKLRNTGLSIGFAFSKISASLMPYLFEYSIDLIGFKGPSIICFCFTILSIFFIYIFKYETRGVSLDKNSYEIK